MEAGTYSLKATNRSTQKGLHTREPHRVLLGFTLDSENAGAR